MSELEDKSVIEVRFFEGDSETPFAASNIPIDQLPDTFEINTVLHLGGSDWQVLGAEPSEKSAFRVRGALDLFLAKYEVSHIDPNDVLYSLPTINNEIAGVEHAQSLENVVVLQEDDWRQFEFVDQQYEPLINEELHDINSIYENHRKDAGFTSLHLRQKITAPMENAKLTRTALDSFFDISKNYDGVAFSTAAATIVGGFASQTSSGWLLWGQENESGHITALNLGQLSDASVVDIAHEIDAFTQTHDLYLVDWSRLFWCGPSQLGFAEYNA